MKNQPKQPTEKAIQYLQEHPELAQHFDSKYGEGASKQYIKQSSAGSVLDVVKTVNEDLKAIPMAIPGVHTLAGGVEHGLKSMAQGTAQLGMDIGNKLGLVDDETVQRQDAYVQQQQDAYQTGHRARAEAKGEGALATAGEIGGNVLATAPIALASPPAGMKIAAPVISRVATNLLQGAAIGAIQPVVEGGTRSQNVAVGAATGVLAPEAMRLAAKVVGKTVNWFKSPVPGGAGNMVDSDIAGVSGTSGVRIPTGLKPEAKAELLEAGIDWDNLPDATRKQIMQAAMDLPEESALKPAELVRKNIVEASRGTPTKAMITGSADDYAQERRIGRTEAGKQLREAYEEIPHNVRSDLDDMRVGIGGTEDATSAGINVTKSLERLKASQEASVTAAYDAAKADPAIANKVSFAPVRKYLMENEPDFLAADATGLWNAAGQKMRTLMGGTTKPMTAENAENFRKWLNTQYNPRNAAHARLVSGLIDATDDSVLRSGTGDVFKQARLQHRLKQMTFKEQETVRSLVGMDTLTDREVPYEKVIDKLLKAPISGLRQVVNTLKIGSDDMAVADIKTSALKLIEDKAFKGVEHKGTANTLKTALDSIGNDRGRYLFGDDWKRLRQMQEALTIARPMDGFTRDSPKLTWRARELFRNIGRKIGGAVVGGMAGGPGGAAAGAIIAEDVSQGVSSLSKGRAAKALTTKPLELIQKARAPRTDLQQYVPPGPIGPTVTLEQILEERREQY